MSQSLLLWKTVHVLSATVLFGGGLAIAFLCWFGYRNAIRSEAVDALRSILRLTVLADAFLTAPAVVVQAVSGIVLADGLGWPMSSAWAIAAWGLFLFVGLCWLPVVAIQIVLARIARNAASIQALPARFHRLFRAWFALGVPAFVAMIVIFYLMIAKPLAPA